MVSKIYDEENTLIMIPGPIEFHPRIIREMSKKVYGHRTEYFRGILRETHKILKDIFGLKSGEVLSLVGSGTLAMDSALRSIVGRDDVVLNLVCGKFSERFYEIAQTTSCKHIITKDANAVLEWGMVFTEDRVKRILDKCEDARMEPTVITICHNETSTGIIHDIESIARVIRDRFPNTIIVVDGITSVGAVPIRMEDWDVDVFIAGSQKCLETPPGLSFVALSERALERLRRFFNNGKLSISSLDGYYNHLAVYLDAWRRKKDLPFTGAVSLYYALKAALEDIVREGIDRRYRRIALMARLLRKAIKAMGLRLLIEEVDSVDSEKYASPTVTAVVYPEPLRGSKDREFRDTVRKLGVLIAGGQERLKGHIFRIATMGRIGPREILTVVGVVELALRRMGVALEESGVSVVLDAMLTENVFKVL